MFFSSKNIHSGAYMIVFLFKFIIFLLLVVAFIIFTMLFVGRFFLKKETARVSDLQKQYDEAQEKCTVKLIAVGTQKIKIIKTFREYIAWDLAIAKSKIEMPLPAVVLFDMPLNLARELKTKLEKLDTIIEIINYEN